MLKLASFVLYKLVVYSVVGSKIYYRCLLHVTCFSFHNIYGSLD